MHIYIHSHSVCGGVQPRRVGRLQVFCSICWSINQSPPSYTVYKQKAQRDATRVEKYFGSVSLTNRRSSAACPRSDRRGSTGAVSAVWRHGRARGLRNGNEGELATQASSSLLSIGSLVRDLSLLCTACSMCPETLLTVPPLGVGRGG